jgi:Flp pilus assembly protein TadG
VEFALILPLLVTLVLGCVDFGRFAYSYVALTNAAQAGANYATSNSYLAAGASQWTTQVQQEAANEMNQQTGYNSQNLTVSVSTTLEGVALRRVQVTATYPFKTIVNWPGISSNVTMSRTVVMRSIR